MGGVTTGLSRSQIPSEGQGHATYFSVCFFFPFFLFFKFFSFLLILFFLSFLLVLTAGPRVSWVLGIHSVTKLDSQAIFFLTFIPSQVPILYRI